MQKKQLIRVNRFIDRLVSAIEAGNDIRQNLYLATWLGKFLTNNPLGIYALDRVEQSLVSQFLNEIERSALCPSYEAQRIHVVSEIYKHGGHTPLFKCLLSSNPTGVSSAALVTRPEACSQETLVDLEREAQVIKSKDTDCVRRIEKLTNILLAADTIVLHIHPDDIEAAIAIRIAKFLNPELRTIFTNHSDHTFSYARSGVDSVLQVSGYGWKLGLNNDLGNRQSYLGIPCEPQPLTIVSDQGKRDPWSIVSGGSDFKFRTVSSDRKLNLYPFIKSSLSALPQASITLIGPSYIRCPWLMLLKLRWPSRVRVLSRMGRSQYRQALSAHGIYLDSYPITGGTAFTEALIMGLNVAGIRGGPSGYGAADQLRINEPDELVSSIRGLATRLDDCLAFQETTRLRALRLHARRAVMRRFEWAVQGRRRLHPPTELMIDQPKYDFTGPNAIKVRVACPSFTYIGEARCAKGIFRMAMASRMSSRFLSILCIKYFRYLVASRIR